MKHMLKFRCKPPQRKDYVKKVENDLVVSFRDFLCLICFYDTCGIWKQRQLQENVENQGCYQETVAKFSKLSFISISKLIFLSTGAQAKLLKVALCNYCNNEETNGMRQIYMISAVNPFTINVAYKKRVKALRVTQKAL